MKKFLNLILLLTSSLNILGASGNATGLVVLSTGWQAEIRLNTLAIGGTYSMGWDTNGNSSAPGVTLNVNSPGFNSDGSTTTVSRVIYGMKRIRKAYPNNADADERTDAGDGLVKIGLSEYLGSECVITSASFLAGWYTGALVTSLSSSLTNNSTQGYKKPVVNNTWPDNERFSSATATLRIKGGHWSGNDGAPIVAIHNILTDESGDAVSNVVTSWSVDAGIYALAPSFTFKTPDMNSTLSLSGLTDTDLLTWRFRAFPRIGNTAAIFDSETDARPLPTTPSTLPGNRKLLYRTTAYGGVAVIGSVGGTPTVYAEGTDPTTIPASSYYGSGQAALAAVKSYNNSTYSHNDTGGSIIYYRTAAPAALLTANTDCGTMETWTTLQEYPGDAWVISAAGNNFSGTLDKIKIVGATVTLTGATTAFSAMDELWFDQCLLNTSGLGPWQTVKVIHVTRCTMGSWSFGIIPFSGGNTSFGVIRQNNLSGLNQQIEGAQVLIGNYCIGGGTSFSVREDASTWNASRPGPDQAIWSDNFFSFSGSTAYTIANTTTISNGFWGYNNIFEGTATGISGTIAATTGAHTTNVFLWNNLNRGLRNQFFYNETGTTATERNFCFSVNNIWDVTGEATDTDVASPNANRIGDWPVRWRVGSTGNITLLLTNMPTHSYVEFPGLYSYHPGSGLFTWTNYTKFVNDQGFENDGGSAGGGNYRLTSQSDMNLNPYKHRWLLPFDLEGVYRGKFDPPGPYASAQPRKGAGFFSGN